MGDPCDFRDALPPGTRIGDHVLLSVVGQGGEGIVYAARDADDAPVLVKEYWPKQVVSRDGSHSVAASRTSWQADHRRGVAKFMALGERLRLLPAHPNVFRAITAIEANNSAYLVMERVPGIPLAQALDEGAFRHPAEIMALADQLSQALCFLDFHGLHHRDIAPDNIVITPGARWKAVLIDFNAARDIMMAMTRSTESVVKAGYSPIEQYAGEGDDAHGVATDIYSASAVLYRAIVGTPPQDASRRAYRADHRTLADLDPPGFPAAFLAAIDKGLEQMPDDRPTDATGWRRMLGFIDGDPASVDAPPPRDRTGVSGRQIGAVAAIAVAALCIGIGIAEPLSRLRAGRAPAPAATPTPVATDATTAFLARNAREPGVTTTPSGLQYRVVKDGTGPSPTDTDVVLVVYKFMLLDGTVMDQSPPQGTPILPTQTIPGFREALKLMRAGSVFRVWIKPELGYGDEATGLVPARSLLAFDLTLVDFKSESEVRRMQKQMIDQGVAPGNTS